MKFNGFTARRAGLLAGALCLKLAAPQQGHAQSMDYGGMEQMFGEPVTTSATGTPQRASEAPADMVIITQDQIRRSGADNIPDILATVPGLDIRRTAMGNADIAIRGYNAQSNPRLLVLLNGRPVYDDFYGFVAWSSIPVQLAEIRQIEVVKGPNSALFGFNAASGVINIVTYDPLYDKVNAASVSAGTQAATEVSGVATLNSPGVGGLRLSAGGMRYNEFDRSADETRAGTHPQNGTVNALGTYLFKDGVQVTLEGGVAQNDFNIYDSAPYAFEIRSNDIRAQLADNTFLGQTSLQFYRNETHEDIGPGSNETNDVYDVQLTDLLKIGASHVVRVNLEYRDNSADSTAFLHGSDGYQDFAASFMWSWQIRDGLALTNAGRLDHLTLRYTGPGLPDFGITQQAIDAVSLTQYTFNSGLVWQATQVDTFRLTAARGLQLPSLFGFGSSLKLAANAYDVGNPSQLPTAVLSLELAYDRALSAINSTAHAGIYAERNDDLSAGGVAGVFKISPIGIGLAADNVGHSDAGGLELGLTGASQRGFTWSGFYTFEAINDHVHAGLTPNEQTDYGHSTPRDVVDLGLGYHHGLWEADVNARWQSTYVDFGGANLLHPAAKLVGDFVTVNTRLGYKIYANTTLAVSATQLLYDRLAETIGPEVERRVLVSLAWKG